MTITCCVYVCVCMSVSSFYFFSSRFCLIMMKHLDGSSIDLIWCWPSKVFISLHDFSDDNFNFNCHCGSIFIIMNEHDNVNFIIFNSKYKSIMIIIYFFCSGNIDFFSSFFFAICRYFCWCCCCCYCSINDDDDNDEPTGNVCIIYV